MPVLRQLSAVGEWVPLSPWRQLLSPVVCDTVGDVEPRYWICWFLENRFLPGRVPFWARFPLLSTQTNDLTDPDWRSCVFTWHKIQTRALACTLTHTPTTQIMQMHTHARTHARARARTHTHTHTHTVISGRTQRERRGGGEGVLAEGETERERG